MKTRTRRAVVGIMVAALVVLHGNAFGGGAAAEAATTRGSVLRRLDERVRELERVVPSPRANAHQRGTAWFPIVWFALGGAVSAVAVTAVERRRERARSPHGGALRA